ncbi:hypothetical protein ABZ825_26700, partial [Streptomyces tauricus]
MLQQPALRPGQPLPGQPLGPQPQAQVLALHQHLARTGREPPARVQVHPGQVEGPLPGDRPGRAPGRVDLLQGLAPLL